MQRRLVDLVEGKPANDDASASTEDLDDAAASGSRG
jgi:hypothetical protein